MRKFYLWSGNFSFIPSCSRSRTKVLQPFPKHFFRKKSKLSNLLKAFPNHHKFSRLLKAWNLIPNIFQEKGKEVLFLILPFQILTGSIKSSLFTCSAATFCQETCLYPTTEIKILSLQSKFGMFIFKEAFHALLHIQPKKEFRVLSWLSLQREEWGFYWWCWVFSSNHSGEDRKLGWRFWLLCFMKMICWLQKWRSFPLEPFCPFLKFQLI